MNKYNSFLVLLFICFGVSLSAPALAMMKVPMATDSRVAPSDEPVQIIMNSDAKVRVCIPGYPEFIYPLIVGVYSDGYDDGHRKHDIKRDMWVGKRLADFLVKHGYVNYVESK